MTDVLIMQGLWWAPVLVVLIAIAAARRVDVRVGWLVGAILAYTVYTIVVMKAPTLEAFAALNEGRDFNWGGKLAAIVASLVMLAVAVKVAGAKWADAGLTLIRREGSLIPSLIATGAMVALMVVLQLLAADGPKDSAEALAYQATLPGLDEELFFRGLLLFLLTMAVVPKRRKADPARFGWAAILATLLFTVGHSFFVSGGALSFDPVIFAYVAILGALLMYIRVRTGSILIPLIAHNVTNVVGHLM
ncbi:CPBP family intramembrane glutamic endopeptidase [Sphingomicrobium clamense]|uniref:CPBP family intramembrane metalloprotease n=1 Tax=Sphingomicrobium clamense TaxID=2851013 RepID=A0ABS6V8V3_9SPHN|nr:CPBP family intramembrane glutamic endopeptidase [Sphingomicrobium sp. B8]MBW0145790.1 CPBP family intramembrane metalloprotease [Sphingomicrobium sp. B8]